MRFFLKKKQRLKAKKKITQLFTKGKCFRHRDILCYYLPCTGLAKHQVLISVGKKIIRKAVQRNKIKRRIREAYRQQQYKISEELLGKTYLIGYVFIGKKQKNKRYTNLFAAITAAMEHILSTCDKEGNTS